MTEPVLLVRSVSFMLAGHAYRYRDETQLHEGIAQLLTEHAIPFEREKILDRKSRPDFVLEGGVVIEVKVDGSLSTALRQVDRYCVFRAVRGCILASTQRWALVPMREKPTLRDKPFTMIHLTRQAL